MAEQQQTPETTPPLSIYARMAGIMSQISRMQKTGHNKFQNYDFATDADVLDELRGKLAEANIAFLPSMVKSEQVIGETKKGDPTTHTVCYFEFRFFCGYTGEVIVALWQGEATDNSDKGINKAATAAEKYFLMKTFMISTGNDPDAESPETTRRNNQRPPVQQQPPPAQPKQQPAAPKAPPAQQQPAANVSALEAPAASATTSATSIDWAVVRSKMRELNWNPDNQKHMETCFPAGTSGMTTAELVEMIAPNPQKKAANQ